MPPSSSKMSSCQSAESVNMLPYYSKRDLVDVNNLRILSGEIFQDIADILQYLSWPSVFVRKRPCKRQGDVTMEIEV